MRVAILDLGTNTFHLLIVSVNAGHEVINHFKSKKVVKLGEGAIHKNIIAEIPFRRGMDALKHYKKIIDQHQPEKIFAFATSAIRSAENGNDFIKAAKEETGISVQVISGDREAELIYYGVSECVDFQDETALIMDIGGGSTEFIIADGQKIFWKKSFNIGAARLMEYFKPSDPIRPEELSYINKFLGEELAPLKEALVKFPVAKLIGSSGSFDTFAEMIGYRYHRKNVIRNVITYEYNIEEFFQLHEILLKSTSIKRMKMKGLIKMRVDMIVLASICTEYVLRHFKIRRMILSKYALKEGVLSRLVSGSLV